MPAYYRASLGDFATASRSYVESKLAEENAKVAFPLQPEALFAWKSQIPILQDAATWLINENPESASWALLLEYPIPRIGKRIDGVLLARDVVVVIEVKTGATTTSAARQVDDYALNLACFHEASTLNPIIPLVVSNAPVARRAERTAFDHLIKPCHFAEFDQIGPILLNIVNAYSERGIQIDPAIWDQARFNPIPPIIDAAVALYSNMNVFAIGHSCAAREDLERTTKTIVEQVKRAQTGNEKIICFVTGIPGAGKTLVGLNAVHEPEIHGSGSFLSGNGPLVKIIREALIRDVCSRERKTRAEAVLTVQTFIQNVHRFADGFHNNSQAPLQHVVVFDEAQRAWDLAESRRSGRTLSEPHMMLEIMDRHPDWAVIITLVGGGQEINRGEAGLAEWGRALAYFPKWQVIASPEVLQGGPGVTGFKLFETADAYPHRIAADESLHLRVAVRSIRAQKISDWVNALLSGKRDEAHSISRNLQERPSLTRSLDLARTWLNEKRRGFTRSGLIGSASANRLRADGLEPSFDFHRRFDWENWFLDDIADVRCSSRLEVFGTQFEVQGLELDWVGVCWGEDLIWDGSKWVSYRFNNKRWLPRRMHNGIQMQKHQFRLNAYRVLLTRARQGMIIYVPRPNDEDSTRLPADLDRTANYLCDCGAVEVN